MFHFFRLAVALVACALAVPAMAQFPDAHDPPPSGWTGPVFHLRQDYPGTLPAAGSTPWTAISFKTKPNDYLKAVLAYALDGNKEVDFVVQNNTKRGWYHAPWMHAGNSGREFIHGLTRERPVPPPDLGASQAGTFETWAVSVYNPRGGYAIGQVWKDPNSPNPAAAKFPVGTVAIKLLFTEAPVSEAPYLANSLEWAADIKRANDASPRPTLRLLQVDVAVRDSRANSTTGWVFGTFVYDGAAPGATPWDRLVPVGLMWGNDPTLLNTATALKETKVNAALQVPQHLGFQGRMNGPADNRLSSCLSCHSIAQVKADLSKTTRASVPPKNATLTTLKLYFRNIKSGTPFDTGAMALDYSLQLQNGIANWAQAHPGGPPSPVAPMSATAVPRSKRLDASHGVNITPVDRGEN